MHHAKQLRAGLATVGIVWALLAQAGTVFAAPVRDGEAKDKPQLDLANPHLPPVLPFKGKSLGLMVKANDPWITPAEVKDLTTTPTYDETLAFVQKLAKASPLLRTEVFGRSPEGRDLVAVIASKDGARLDPKKPVVLVQGGIHSGEIDGKDAGLMLLRDITQRGKANLLDKVNLVFVPIYNVDGHERSSAYSRPNQRGPVEQGWRQTAQNLNLNRDFAKADAPETRAMLALIEKYDPALYLDLHVTDGLDYQHDITFTYEAWGGQTVHSAQGGVWLEKTFKPKVDAALVANGHIPGPYIDPTDGAAPEKGMVISPGLARFSTGFGDSIGLPTVLVETHSLKPYKQRVLGTYVLIEAALKVAGDQAQSLLAARDADRKARPETVHLNYHNSDEPFGYLDFKPVEREIYTSPVTGKDMVRWTGRPAKTVSVPLFGSQPSEPVTLPASYIVPATKTEVIARLRAHGIEMETFDAPKTLQVEQYRFTKVSVDPKTRELEGHYHTTFEGLSTEKVSRLFPKGSVRVRLDQPKRALIAILLEPQSQESLLSWGFFPEIGQRVEYMEAYAIGPLGEAMMKANPALKTEFEAKLKADPVFAASPEARLAFFYDRSPYKDNRYLVYPVARELRP